ncbi:hypothetical protein ACET3X_002062 [Alternaria dauci]|uniref:Uncharacterized protein n=1 Tax=Alternaria dauci TaxID=48095 RepID=A0ABR3UZ49_9PLEO
MVETISPDYLVVGAGAGAMAFVDTLIVSNPKATVAMVDKYAQPGGHWNVAYPFVTLHQPSSVYGVNSRKLGDNKPDQIGLNKGFFELATGPEIVGYYARVMNSTLLPSGRVSYYPLHNYTREGEFESIATGKHYQVGPKTRIVDATYSMVRVPSMNPPKYEVSDQVKLITPNALVSLDRPYGGYTLVGAGKTATDACVWLLSQNIDPKKISWIMPRDSWFIERGTLQPTQTTPNPEQMLKDKADALMGATTSQEYFLRMESYGFMHRIDKNVTPTRMKAAIISKPELETIQRVKNIIRKGRVTRIDADKVTLAQGTYTPAPDTLYIDCSATGYPDIPPVPIWNGRQITIQVVKLVQPTFGAALIGHIEATYDSDEKKNDICKPLHSVCNAESWSVVVLESMRNRLKWIEEPKVAAWIEQSRLDDIVMGAPPRDPEEAKKHNESIPYMVQGTCAKLEEIVRNDEALAAAP